MLSRPLRLASGARGSSRFGGHRFARDRAGLVSQIEEALRSRALEHFVPVVRPAALESANMRREKRVLPGPSPEPIQGLWRNCALEVWTGRKAEPEELRSCVRATVLFD